MIKTAKEILLEKGIDIDALEREKSMTKEKLTAGLIDFISEWFDKHEADDVLCLEAVYDFTDDKALTKIQRTKRKFVFVEKYNNDGFLCHLVKYDGRAMKPIEKILKALGFYIIQDFYNHRHDIVALTFESYKAFDKRRMACWNSKND